MVEFVTCETILLKQYIVWRSRRVIFDRLRSKYTVQRRVRVVTCEKNAEGEILHLRTKKK
jgi:hypothetical protein